MDMSNDDEPWRQFTDPRARFRVEVPASWYVEQAEGTFTHIHQARLYPFGENGRVGYAGITSKPRGGGPMLVLPADIIALLNHFAPLFSRRTWRHVPSLVVGALLAPGQRMVSSALRAVGLAHMPTFQTYHRILNRAVWSNLGVSRILLRLLVAAFLADNEPLVLGIDETIERRRGKKIAAAGIYRDPVRSSHGHFVKVNGLRWVCLMLLAPIPWAGRIWALPFLTALAPSERYAQERHRRHKSVTTWARQLIRLVHRWVPGRRLVMVGDRGYATLELLDAVRPVATFITRLRLDAHLCAPPPPPHAAANRSSSRGRQTASHRGAVAR